ncbi:hypothetical protein LMG3410_02674 [Achromobacter aegrifaciens]|nr:hypothetical protein LMG3410_02674 [Achromobacter aegrifaciens]
MLVSRPVIAFALLRQCSEAMSTDLLSGIAILIRPLVNDLANEIFDSRVLAERLATAYGISVPAVALEGMTHRLVAANILRIEQTGAGATRALYTANSDSESIAPDSEADFQAILDDFLEHAAQRLMYAGKRFTQEQLTTGFLRHLATLDFSAIKARPVVLQESGSTIVGPAAREQIELSAELADQAVLDALVASYVAFLQEHQPARLQLLAQVADGALAAELVFDLQAPTSVSRLVNTTVVVDTPLILSYLDLSSSQDTVDAKRFLTQIQEAGARVAAFQHSIEEAEGVLKAIQTARGTGLAYGPSVHRLSNATFRAYFDSMIGSIRRVWTQTHNFEVVAEAATHFHVNFTQADEEELGNAIRLNMYDRVLTRERDAKSIAETIRRNGGAHVPMNSIGSCRFIFVTPNASLQRRAFTFLSEHSFLYVGDFNPIVTNRYLSGLCWLMCGGRSDQSPTTAKLLANCAAALRLKPEIADRTKRFLAGIDSDKAIHFEALMTNERASQYLAEATLGDVNVITANNVEEIYEEVQRRAAEKVAIEKDREYQGQISVLEATLRESNDATDKLRSALSETQLGMEQRAMEVRELSQRSSELASNYEKSLEKISEQERQLSSLGVQASEATKAATSLQALLGQQWERGRAVADQYAKSWTNRIRWMGVFVLFSLALGAGYIDKFITPHLPPEYQATINISIVIVQATLAIAGVASLVDPLIKRPLERLRRRLYLARLATLGVPEEQTGN